MKRLYYAPVVVHGMSAMERLKAQSGIISPRNEHWRSMVDCVMIDSAYDADIFNVTRSAAPEPKDDLFTGGYTLLAPEAQTAVAVKIIDMLGEEVLKLDEVQGILMVISGHD